MKNVKVEKKAPAASANSSGEGFEARTSYPVQLHDPIERARNAVSTVTKQDLTGFNVSLNSSRPDKLGALATIQGKNIDMSPAVSDLSKPANAEVLLHELGHAEDQMKGVPATDTIAGTRVNTDPARENYADKVAHEAMQHF